MLMVCLYSRQGKLRLQKWYDAKEPHDKKKIVRDLTSTILARQDQLSSCPHPNPHNTPLPLITPPRLPVS